MNNKTANIEALKDSVIINAVERAMEDNCNQRLSAADGLGITTNDLDLLISEYGLSFTD